MERNIVAVLAGGKGKRMKTGRLPKQFLKIGKEAIFIKTIKAFKAYSSIQKAILVIPKLFIKDALNEIKKNKLEDFVDVIEGGKMRQESSYKALKHIERIGGCDYVLIHDAVRPFVTKKIILESIKTAKKYGASEVAVPSIDTLVETDGRVVRSIPKRENFFYTQTPQTFKFSLILKIHEKEREQGNNDATDDAGLALKFGQNVRIVRGNYENIKITSSKDYELAKLINKTHRY